MPPESNADPAIPPILAPQASLIAPAETGTRLSISSVPPAEPAGHESVPSVTASRLAQFGFWLREEWIVLGAGLLGFALMVASQWIQNHPAWIQSHAETTQSRPAAPGPHHIQLPDYLVYFVEHLGAVLLVAMLVRIALEEKFQQTFLNRVQRGVENSIDETSKEVLPRSLGPLKQRIDEFNDTIERADKQIDQLHVELTYKIFEALDPQLRKDFEEKVMNAPFFRPKYHLQLRMRPFVGADGKNDPDILEVHVSNKYWVTNYSKSQRTFPVKSWLDDIIWPAGKREARFTRFAFGQVFRADPSGEREDDPLDDLARHPEKYQAQLLPNANIDDLKAEHINSAHGMLHFQYPIERINPGDTYEVVIEGIQLMHRHDNFVWNFVTLTKQLYLTLDLEGGLTDRDLEVFPRLLHHGDDPQRNKAKETATRLVDLTHQQVFLPYQGVEIRWSPKVNRESLRADPAVDGPAGAAAPSAALPGVM